LSVLLFADFYKEWNKISAHGAWRMAHGAWRMAHGAWRMAHGAWRMAHGAVDITLDFGEVKNMGVILGQLPGEQPTPCSLFP
jgi:hypothetical protein